MGAWTARLPVTPRRRSAPTWLSDREGKGRGPPAMRVLGLPAVFDGPDVGRGTDVVAPSWDGS